MNNNGTFNNSKLDPISNQFKSGNIMNNGDSSIDVDTFFSISNLDFGFGNLGAPAYPADHEETNGTPLFQRKGNNTSSSSLSNIGNIIKDEEKPSMSSNSFLSSNASPFNYPMFSDNNFSNDNTLNQHVVNDNNTSNNNNDNNNYYNGPPGFSEAPAVDGVPVVQGSSDPIGDKLKEMKEWFDKGYIDNEEYKNAKKEILNSSIYA